MLNAVAAYQSNFQAYNAPNELKNKAFETQFVKASNQDLTQKKTNTALDDVDKGVDQAQTASRKSGKGEGRGQFVDVFA